MRRLSKRAQGMQATTAPQAVEGLKTQFQATMTELNNMMQQLQGSVGKMNEMMRAVEQLETQVGQLEQMKQQTQQAAQQQQQGVQQAKDQILPGGKGDKLTEKDVDPEELKKGIKEELEHTESEELAKEIALDHLAEEPKYYTLLEKLHKEDQAIDWKTMLGKGWAKVVDLLGRERADEIYTPNAVAGVRGSDKRKAKKPKHLSPRDKEHNKDLPDFWRENYDYGESPYMHIDEIEKITDKPPMKKKVKKKK